jgi:hypothetical protein
MKSLVTLPVAVVALVGALFVAPSTGADMLVQSFNVDKDPSTDTFYASEAGWLYTSSQSYDLTRIATRFASTDGRVVTVELYDGLPSGGANLLASTNFIPFPDVFSSADFFTPIHVDAGHSYFVGFRNISGLGSNITFDAAKTDVGPAYISSGGNSLYTSLCLPSSAPILQFFGAGDEVPATPTPLPSSALTGALLLGGLTLRTRRRRGA